VNKIKYDSNSIKLIIFFESMTGARVKDCIINEKIMFIVEENEMAKAIGRNGANIKKVEMALKKKVRLVEFSNDVYKFVKNIVYPIEIKGVSQEDGAIVIQGKDNSTKALLLGREKKNIKHLSNIVKRYFNIKEIKVV